jgi:hypothetical protein
MGCVVEGGLSWAVPRGSPVITAAGCHQLERDGIHQRAMAGLETARSQGGDNQRTSSDRPSRLFAVETIYLRRGQPAELW